MQLYTFLLSFMMGAGAWCFLAWAVKDGQFNSLEENRALPIEAEDRYN